MLYFLYKKYFKKVKYNMQTSKLMTNLAIYVLVFTIVVCTVAYIMVYFYSNMKQITSKTYANSDYSILNLYFLKLLQADEISIEDYGLVDNDDITSYYITFKKEDGTSYTFIKLGDMIYYNGIKLCENVEEFKVIVDKSEKGSISTEVKISGNVFKSQYAL